MTSDPTKTARHGAIVAVVDPDTAPAIVAIAAHQAASRGLPLDVVSVVEPPREIRAAARAAGLTPDGLMERLVDHRRQAVLAAIGADVDAPVSVVPGKAFIEIIRHAQSREAALVIKAPDPFAGAVGRLFASTDQHLLRKCPMPVWLCEPEASGPVRTVVAAVDVDPEAPEPETLADVNARVIQAALAVCEPQGEIHILHAWQAEDAGLFWAFGNSGDGEAAAQRYADMVKAERQRAVQALAEAFAPDAGGPRLIARLVRGAPHSVIADQCRRVRADALVMGTVARTGLHGVIIGNTAENILNTATGSVIAVKPSGFISPIL